MKEMNLTLMGCNELNYFLDLAAEKLIESAQLFADENKAMRRIFEAQAQRAKRYAKLFDELFSRPSYYAGEKLASINVIGSNSETEITMKEAENVKETKDGTTGCELAELNFNDMLNAAVLITDARDSHFDKSLKALKMGNDEASREYTRRWSETKELEEKFYYMVKTMDEYNDTVSVMLNRGE